MSGHGGGLPTAHVSTSKVRNEKDPLHSCCRHLNNVNIKLLLVRAKNVGQPTFLESLEFKPYLLSTTLSVPSISQTLLNMSSLYSFRFPECFTSWDSQLTGYCLIQKPQTFNTAVETCENLAMELLHLGTETEQATVAHALAHLLHDPVTVWARSGKPERPLK